MKKIFNYSVFLVLFLSFVGIIAFGSLLRHHYLGGERFQSLQKIVVTIAEIPANIKYMLDYRTINLNITPSLQKHKDKKRFEQFIENKRNILLVLPRHDGTLSKVVDIIDLNNFEIIHTYNYDIDELNNQVTNTQKFSRLQFINIIHQNPLLLEDGSLTGIYGPTYKIDFCSNLQWLNDEILFHHSQMLDHEGNIWIGGHMNPKSKYVKKYSIQDYEDDSIVKINTDGKILFNKSVVEILIENNIVLENFVLNTSLLNKFDPLHLNDIEPAFSDTEYWKQGDLFLSLRNQSSIIHYRPSTNKIINYITGPFARQHDVDIISDQEISIFNNNNFFANNEHSEIIIYNFKTKTFRKLFNDQLKKENFKTKSQGLSHILKDGSLLVEEQNHGRIILFNNQGKKEWEFVNKDKNGFIAHISWSRVIEDELFIEKFKSIVKNKKCLN